MTYAKAKERAIALPEPIVVTFSVRDPESINRKYGRGVLRNGVKAMFTNPAVKAFEDRVTSEAWFAIVSDPLWPHDPWQSAAVTVSYQLYDCGFDGQSCIKSVCDALENVAYRNDRIVTVGTLPPPIKDGRGRRIEIRLELHAIFDEETIRALQLAVLKRRANSSKRASARPQKRHTKQRKPRFIA
jgi:hypothetical protein